MTLTTILILLGAYLIGALSYLIGIVLSAVVDLPTGAVTVWTMAVVALVGAALIGRRK